MNEPMTPDVVRAPVLRDYKVLVVFADGRRGTYDFDDRLWGPAFAPLEDYDTFAALEVDAGTIVWKLGADDPYDWLDWSPEELYHGCDPYP